MNPPPPPPAPFPNPSSYTFLPPNPNPNFFPSHLHHPPSPSSTSTSTSTTNLPTLNDLHTTLSTLKQLINLSQAAIICISTLLPPTASTSTSSATCPCPFNPHHQLLPKSLFRHFFQCSSSTTPLDPSLLQSLHYPKTLQSSAELINQNRFVQTLHDPSTDLCFSLDDYFNFRPNFFYKDCPGVVTSSNQNNTNPMLTLPGVLCIECANFIGSGDKETKGFDRNSVRLLPSEIWIVRSEIEAWNEYPSSYSYAVLRAILCLKLSEFHDLMRWIIVNSPRYGAVIDVPMRDHIVLLFRLCLKAIIGEAIGLADPVFNREVELSPKMNGKLFAVNMLKQCLFYSLLNSSLHPLERNTTESPPLKRLDDMPLGKSTENEGNNIAVGTVSDSVVFVSQVAAAVAALHERSFLEEKIKGLRNPQALSDYQRMAEHAYISKRADEERRKRTNFRPILEHDGLLWQHSRNHPCPRSRQDIVLQKWGLQYVKEDAMTTQHPEESGFYSSYLPGTGPC
ncbi:unnamed protein product [Ilex paraguariensis]|uniref:CHHC U11-48K-type domain-containing protein n=1 Tax=Ilex paraguariensis TaxID=185542 RepID=A0ABC8QY91_9AQUA